MQVLRLATCTNGPGNGGRQYEGRSTRGEYVILRAEFIYLVTKALSDVQTIQNRKFQIDYLVHWIQGNRIHVEAHITKKAVKFINEFTH
jgi:hypothetical protein